MSSNEIYEGTLKRVFVQSASKEDIPSVVLETAGGNTFKLEVRDLDPVTDHYLDAYIGRYVEIEAAVTPHDPQLLKIRKFSDIAVKKGPGY